MAICDTKPATTTDAYKAMERTIAKLAHKWARNNFQDFDDLFSEGCIGLMKAYDQFDESAGMAFSSYAYRKIDAEMFTKVKKMWNQYNTTSSKDVNVVMEDELYLSDIDDLIDLDAKIKKEDPITQFICMARLEGYTFEEISDLLAQQGTSMTLHQARKAYMSVMAE